MSIGDLPCPTGKGHPTTGKVHFHKNEGSRLRRSTDQRLRTAHFRAKKSTDLDLASCYRVEKDHILRSFSKRWVAANADGDQNFYQFPRRWMQARPHINPESPPMAFDPYHQWLGIQPDEQPPHHYRLLGIGEFESDPDVISSAADRQMAHVKTFQMGEHVAESQRLLSEIVAARHCLLKTESRAQYDLQLRQRTGDSDAAPGATPPQVAATTLKPRAPASRSRGPLIIIAGVVVTVGMLAVLAGFLLPGQGTAITENAAPEKQAPADSAIATSVETNANDHSATPESANAAEATEETEGDPEASTAPESVKPARLGPLATAGTPEPFTSAPVTSAPLTPAPVKPDPDTVDPRALDPVTPEPSETPENDPRELPAKLPIPSQAARTAALKLVRDVYQAEYAEAETDEQKAAVAQRVLTDAKDPEIDANGRFAMLGVARMMAVQAGDVDTAMSAIDALDQQYEVDALPMKYGAFQSWSKMAMAKETRSELAKRMPPLAEAAARQERYDLGVNVLQLARDSARRAGDVELAKEVAAKLKEMESLAEEFAGVQQAITALKADPTDKDANLAVGSYYCLVRGDWPRGLPLLAKGSPGVLQAAAERDLSGAGPGAAQLALGDMWWELAQKEDAAVAADLLSRAHHWYRLAAPNLTGLAKTKCEKRIAEMKPAPSSVADRSRPARTTSSSGLEFDGKAWLETNLKYDGKTPLTLEAWITPAAVTGQIVANCHGNGLGLQVSADGYFSFQVRDLKGYRGGRSNEKAKLGERTHVAGVFDGRTVRIYVNGKLQEQIGKMSSTHKVSNLNFMIGADPDYHSKPQTQFRGRIDSVHVAFAVLYDKDFTPRDPPTRTAATVLLLKLDEGEGVIARDSSRFQRHAKIHDAEW